MASYTISYEFSNERELVSDFVVQLARCKNVKSQLTRVDQLASTFTILAGEPAKRDEIDDLIVKMGQLDVLTPSEVTYITAAHIAEKRG
tara:strand:+ start:535 stop:801 length:267 start_codon:yes stop_codon:yes gene_type:complete